MIKILENKYVGLCIAFAIGIIVTVYFYPEKTVIKEVQIESEAQNKKITELESKLQSMEKEKRKVNTVVIERPGEKITTIIDESEKTKEIEFEYNTKILEKNKEIRVIQDKYKEEINKKTTTIEVGYMIDKEIYFHANRQIYGPMLLGAHIELGKKNNFGIGIGFKF